MPRLDECVLRPDAGAVVLLLIDVNPDNRVVDLIGNQFGDDRTLCFAQLLPTPIIGVNPAYKFITNGAALLCRACRQHVCYAIRRRFDVPCLP
jgi:hypothetical protein